MSSSARWLLALPLCAAFLACSDDTTPKRDGSAPDAKIALDLPSASGEAKPATPATTYVQDDLLSTLGLTFLKGRTCGRLSIDAKTADARAALIAFGETVTKPIAGDGSTPADANALKGIIPAPPAPWQEDTAVGTAGPWVNLSATDWINGGAKPFTDNGFVAVAGEEYVDSAKGWHLTVEVVLLGSTSAAAAALQGAEWNKGTQTQP